MPNEHGIEGCSQEHTDNGKPCISDGLWRSASIANAQHVRYRFEQGPGVLLRNSRILNGTKKQMYTVHAYAYGINDI